MVDEKLHTVHGIEVQKKNRFDITSWIEDLEDMAFVLGLLDCCRV